MSPDSISSFRNSNISLPPFTAASQNRPLLATKKSTVLSRFEMEPAESNAASRSQDAITAILRAPNHFEVKFSGVARRPLAPALLRKGPASLTAKQAPS